MQKIECWLVENLQEALDIFSINLNEKGKYVKLLALHCLLSIVSG